MSSDMTEMELHLIKQRHAQIDEHGAVCDRGKLLDEVSNLNKQLGTTQGKLSGTETQYDVAMHKMEELLSYVEGYGEGSLKAISDCQGLVSKWKE